MKSIGRDMQTEFMHLSLRENFMNEPAYLQNLKHLLSILNLEDQLTH
jgi:hypothetical protein